ncbi:MAG: STAS domain-containing protein [Spirochaetota bacterium]|mgnify:CR=1 FL=1
METIRKGNYVILVVDTDLVADDAIMTFKAKLTDIIATDEKDIILDFGNVRAVSSSGIGKILLLYKKLKEKKGSMGFVNLHPQIAELFDKLMFLDLFTVYASANDIPAR